MRENRGASWGAPGGLLGGECSLGRWPLVQMLSVYAGSLVGVAIV